MARPDGFYCSLSLEKSCMKPWFPLPREIFPIPSPQRSLVWNPSLPSKYGMQEDHLGQVVGHGSCGVAGSHQSQQNVQVVTDCALLCVSYERSLSQCTHCFSWIHSGTLTLLPMHPPLTHSSHMHPSTHSLPSHITQSHSPYHSAHLTLMTSPTHPPSLTLTLRSPLNTAMSSPIIFTTSSYV